MGLSILRGAFLMQKNKPRFGEAWLARGRSVKLAIRG